MTFAFADKMRFVIWRVWFRIACHQVQKIMYMSPAKLALALFSDVSKQHWCQNVDDTNIQLQQSFNSALYESNQLEQHWKCMIIIIQQQKFNTNICY